MSALPAHSLRSRATALILGGALAVLLLPAMSGSTTRANTAAAATPLLPFDLPAASVLRASPRKVFVHWVPSLPISLDNQPASVDYYTKNYLSPSGEGGADAAYGGFLRDRPLPRPVRTETNWRLLDMEDEVRQAISEGLDGFSTTIYALPGDAAAQDWTNNVLMAQAAAAVDPGFKIVLQPDMSGSLKNKSAAVLASAMAQLASYGSTYHLADGRMLFSPFNAESHSAAWWQSFLDIMKNQYGIPIAFLPVFQDERPQLTSFAPISYGVSNWGNRNPAWNNPTSTTATSAYGRIATVHSLGLAWMQPVSVQDERPREGTFQEALNTLNLRDTWQIAISNHAEFVQLNTWNDYPEGSQMAPSQQNGWSWLDMSSYYLTWYKTGVAPPIVRDTVYLTHRIQPWQAKPTYPETLLMTFPSVNGGSLPRDTVEALTFMTAPGSVAITVGGQVTTCNVPAGVSACLAPLVPGKVSALTYRNGVTTAAVTSPYQVTNTPYVQDLHYAAASSGRQGTVPLPPPPGVSTPVSGPSPSPTPTPTSTTAPVTKTVTATADVTADQTVPSTATGSYGYLVSRGNGGRLAVSYLRFVLPAAPQGTTLTGATLQLRTSTDPAAGSLSAFTVQTGADTWTEPTLTWANRPTTSGTTLGTLPAAGTPNTPFSVVLSPTALQSLLGKQVTMTLSSTGTDAMYLFSREAANASYRPQLVLTFK